MTRGYRAPRLTLPVGARDHSEGPSDIAVTLVEYGDYQCPYCGAAYPVVKRLRQQLGPTFRFVFRNFPLTNLHPDAQRAAEAAEAAGAQGKFWEMHDLLFENQARLGEADFPFRYAGQLSLDRERLEREVATHVYRARVEEDYGSGIRSGVNGTPTFFVNGSRYDGRAEFEPLRAALKSAGNSSR